MMIVGTADNMRRPSIGRAMGLHFPGQEDVVELTISAWQWPDTLDNIRQTGRMAATFASIADYVSYQMKGRASLRLPTEPDIERGRRYVEHVSRELSSFGVPGQVWGNWLNLRDPMIARLEVEEVYVQTPGPKAGMSASVAS